MEDAVQHDVDVFQTKILDYAQLSDILAVQRPIKQIVQCHGVFDLLHVGHIRHFQQAKKHGDILVVSITADTFVNKGPSRPAFSERLRAEVIAALDCVDYVLINHAPTAIEAIQCIQPHVYVKGCEYQKAEDDITGKISEESQAVEAHGGKTVFTEDITFSSSNLINRFIPTQSPELRSFINDFKTRYSIDDILTYIENTKNLKVLVLGETILDEYIYCNAMGKSGKEPVLATKYVEKELYAGGILAIANHVADFCKSVSCLTLLGENAEHEDFIRTNLKKKVKPLFHYKTQSPTLLKRRYVEKYLKQKLFEMYDMNDDKLSSEQEAAIADHLSEIIEDYDVVIVADYGHGMLTRLLRSILVHTSKFLAINTQANAGNQGFNFITKYRRADYVCVAGRELELTLRERNKDVAYCVRRLVKEHDYRTVTVTSGNQGITTYKKGSDFQKVPAFAHKVTDRVGAGDAVLAITSLLAATNTPADVLGFIGNVIGAEAVTIMGNERFIEKIPLMKHISHLLK